MRASSSNPWTADSTPDGSRCIVHLTGALDRRAAPALLAFLNEQCGAGEEIVLDLGQVTRVDASGIGAILDAHTACAEMGGVLTATAARDDVQCVLERVLQITGLQHLGPFESESAPGRARNEPSRSAAPTERLRHRFPPRSWLAGLGGDGGSSQPRLHPG
jgi:anti-anti-sigma factor